MRYVTRDYFEILGIPPRSGRGFGDRDSPGSPRAAAISEAPVRRDFAGEDAIGHRIRYGRLCQ
jgi:hypothetical protein